MKIAATYDNGNIFQHFGRTEYFKVYEVEDNKIVGSRVIGSNGVGHGALAGLLADQDIKVLICGGLGGGALNALRSAGIEDLDLRMKPYFYPDLEKQELFAKGYIASQSSHSRGSTVDLTLLDMSTGKEVDMGSPFDMFSEVSHPDYRGITEQQYDNRMILQQVMVRSGFSPIDCEWWHFTLNDEPFPDTYFDFPVSAGYLKR